MDRLDFFFQQLVLESDLDAALDRAEASDLAMFYDMEFGGILSGLPVTQTGPASLSVEVNGGIAYDRDGKRIRLPGIEFVDVSVDSASAPTDVIAPGNERWVSVFIRAARALSDPRIDGMAMTVYYHRDESFEFYVEQGAEALVGTAVRPVIPRSDSILLADIQRTFGVSTILNAAIYTDRREWLLQQDDSGASGVSNAGKLIPAALDDLADVAADHINGAAYKHAAQHVTFSPSELWKTGVVPSGPPSQAKAGLDAIVRDLAESVTTSGADRVGSKLSSAAFADASVLAVGSVWSQINALVAAIGTSALPSGAKKLGAEAQTIGGESVIAGTLFQQITSILTSLNGKATAANFVLKAGDTMSGSLLTSVLGNDLGSASFPWEAFLTQARLGNTLTSTAANARIARLLASICTTATSRRTLIMELPNLTAANASVRVYASNFDTAPATIDPNEGVEIAINCSWNGTAWTPDVQALESAKLVRLDLTGVIVHAKTWIDPGSNWTDDQWENPSSPSFRFTASPTTPLLSLDEGRVHFTNTSTVAAGSNPPYNSASLLGNTLYAKSMVKAWLSFQVATNAVSVVEGYNFDTPTVGAGTDIVTMSFVVDMFDANYIVLATAYDDFAGGARVFFPTVLGASQAASGFQMTLRRDDGGLQDLDAAGPWRFKIAVLARQDTTV
jgi:hypothetical protein